MYKVIMVYKSNGKSYLAKVMSDSNEVGMVDIPWLYENRKLLINAVVTSDGVVRGKNCSLLFKDIRENIINCNLYVNNRSYKGSSDKFGITYKGINYIVKPQSSDVDSSIFSEYVASKFISMLGIPVQEVLLTKSIIDGKKKVCCLIKDFTDGGCSLREFEMTEESSCDSVSNLGYTFKDIYKVIKNHKKMDLKNKKLSLLRFWQMFVCDAILANRDRHEGNWGFLSRVGYSYEPAPIYDNGSSLFPDVLARIDGYSADKKKFLLERSNFFPASMLKVYSRGRGRDRRSNYYEYLESDHGIKELRDVLEGFKRYNGSDIFCIAKRSCANDNIPKVLRLFYTEVITLRFLRMVKRMPLEDCYKELINIEGV